MKKTIYTLILMGACSAALLQTGCKKNPTDGIKLTVDADIIKYNVLIQYVDASGNTIVNVPNDHVTISGQTATSVYNIAGKKDYSITGGMLTLGLSPDVTPTAANPASFSVAVNADGYLPVTTQIKMNPSVKQQIITVTLVNLSQNTPGISIKKTTTTLDNNALPAALTIATDPTVTSSVQSCKVAMQSGTQFSDVNGNPLSGSDLSVTMASFDANNETSAAAFPGGYSADAINGPAGQMSATFLTAGFANVSMTLDGQQVKHFNQPITISMTMDPTTINPNTGAAVQAGDSIDVYTYDEGTALWSYETKGVVTSNGGGLSVSYNVQHLTWTNVTWTVQNTSCGTGSLIASIPNTTTSGASQLFDFEVDYKSRKLITVSLPVSDGMYIPTSSFSSIQGYTVKIFTHGTSDLLATLTNVDPCSNTPVVLNVTGAQVITGDLYGTCPNKNNQQVRPSFYLNYKPAGSSEPYKLLGYVSKGHISTTILKLGQSYDFMSYYGTQKVEALNHTVDKTEYTQNITLPDDICSSL